MTAESWTIQDGDAGRQGSFWDGNGVNFAVYSSVAKKVELCLFDDSGRTEIARLPLPARTGDVWHGYVPGAKPGQLYGYRVTGDYNPAAGARCNPAKLLFDPFARETGGTYVAGEIHNGGAPGNPGRPDPRDNAPFMLKARVAAPLEDSGPSPLPVSAATGTVYYEAHLRGLTMEFPGLPEDVKRGTCEALASDAVIAHLKKTGVEAIELMPVHAGLSEARLDKVGLTNYWGYNTLGFLAPDPRFLQSGHAADFRAMVSKLHAAGIKVVLDVVYNHTCEGNENGPTLSFRGLDNAAYYRLQPDRSRYFDMSGCGNTLNTDHPQVRHLILESLRYWAGEMGVDGFRFDLAAALGRNERGFSADHPLFQDIRNDPVLARVRLIAEPWSADDSPASYQLGNFPPEWEEWNGKFRDDVRDFWRGRDGMAAALATRLAGSADLFERRGGTPRSSVNAVTYHDGFTLSDLVSYNSKHNEANGENNRDGCNDNRSDNHGAEGPTHDAAIRALRLQQMRNMLATAFLAQGAPLLLAGDEVCNGQQGNNNAYCQDNPLGWVNWSDSAAAREMADFTAALSALRRDFPVLRSGSYLHGRNFDAHGVPDVQWFSTEGREQTPNDWAKPWARSFGMMLNNGAVQATRPDGAPDNRRLYAVFNAHGNPVPVTLPVLKGGEDTGWQRILDTSQPTLPSGGDGTLYPAPAGAPYSAKGHSLTVFQQNPAPAPMKG